MPDLSQDTIDDLSERLAMLLGEKSGYHSPHYLAAGGSAAVYRVETPEGPRAFKVFDPRFVSNEEGSKERHRLTLQERLIGHNCENLVQTYNIELKHDTAFIEMEFIAWPQLKEVLAEIPDEAISSLIAQLITAVRFLESLNIVHRDIKPENIHITRDFKSLKLLDLGVVREFDPGPEADETDHGALRVFLATAQYSPPEYLFRLDPPSEELWKALNFYQVGAVLHDLIMKEPIFQAEMATGNRWLVAKAVLLKQPTFVDGTPGRLAKLKSLATKCLTKDMQTRLQIVCWNDFKDSETNPMITLRDRLKTRHTSIETRHSRELIFQRDNFRDKLTTTIRERLISICQTDLPFELSNSTEEHVQVLDLIFDTGKYLSVLVRLYFSWQDGIYSTNVNIELSSCLFGEHNDKSSTPLSRKLICSTSFSAGTDEVSSLVCVEISAVTALAIDLIDAADGNDDQIRGLVNFDILSNK
ncbi:serine/threonine protein kinase [Pseudomonas sp. JAI120]|uniref:serine/threonine protein kinase n=1 Tax=Pseudomonas sp. JAI120 TaxID=2723063 RepID=UPI0030D9A95C